MSDRTMGRRRLAAVGLVLAAGTASHAVAQPAPEAQAIWDRFADVCPQVVAADNPAMFAARMAGEEGSAGQSADGAVRLSNLAIYDLGVGEQLAVLIVYENVFEEGRAVQCLLQVIGLPDVPKGLADLTRAQAGTVLGEDAPLVVSGGAVAGMTVSGGLPSGVDPDLQGAEIVRISTGGFPPRGVVTVQALPQATILMLNVLQETPAE